MKLIDVDALIVDVTNVAKKCAKSDVQKALMGRVIYILEHRCEDVVRCKDCEHGWKKNESSKLNIYQCDKWENIMRDCDFCSLGERRNNGTAQT